MNEEIPELVYRNATVDDVISVSKLVEETFRESWTEEGNESDVDQYINEHFSEQQVAIELADKSISYLVAFEKEYPIAYVKLERNLQPDNHQLEKPISIARVYVRKSFQGMRIGSFLMEKAEKIATEENFKTLWLGVWNENFNAIRLYERFGFKRFGDYKFIMGSISSDDYLMMKEIQTV